MNCYTMVSTSQIRENIKTSKTRFYSTNSDLPLILSSLLFHRIVYVCLRPYLSSFLNFYLRSMETYTFNFYTFWQGYAKDLTISRLNFFYRRVLVWKHYQRILLTQRVFNMALLIQGSYKCFITHFATFIDHSTAVERFER